MFHRLAAQGRATGLFSLYVAAEAQWQVVGTALMIAIAHFLVDCGKEALACGWRETICRPVAVTTGSELFGARRKKRAPSSCCPRLVTSGATSRVFRCDNADAQDKITRLTPYRIPDLRPANPVFLFREAFQMLPSVTLRLRMGGWGGRRDLQSSFYETSIWRRRIPPGMVAAPAKMRASERFSPSELSGSNLD